MREYFGLTSPLGSQNPCELSRAACHESPWVSHWRQAWCWPGLAGWSLTPADTGGSQGSLGVLPDEAQLPGPSACSTWTHLHPSTPILVDESCTGSRPYRSGLYFLWGGLKTEPNARMEQPISASAKCTDLGGKSSPQVPRGNDNSLQHEDDCFCSWGCRNWQREKVRTSPLSWKE